MLTCNTKQDWIFKLADIALETKNRYHYTTCLSLVDLCTELRILLHTAFLAVEMLAFTSGNMGVKESTACDIYSFGILMCQEHL